MTDAVLTALRRRLASRGVTDLVPLAGGASSLTYRGSQDGRPVVVKMAPPGRAPVAHRDVLRQARIIAALSGSDVPVPQLLWCDAGDPPGVPPLFAMTLVAGESFEPLFDATDAPADPAVAQRYYAAAGTMARLHRLDPAALGCTDEPIGDAASEIERWSATLATVDPELAPGWRDVGEALRARLPAPAASAVVHGDFRLGNLLAVGSEITAVIDWEIWSIGDPRIDAGWFLINSDPQTYRRDTRYAGDCPGIGELADCYIAARGTDVAELEYFKALACFKSAATWSLIVKHNRRASAPRAELEAMAAAVPGLLTRAQDLLG
ncbi:phosphotransferase family protein [[Mycobacterium] holstebronense]|uniref:Phosphotransferase family protein n=1 Tax=[Mycobacterium] holstebronense TaxID=3064288 RepID=A0ABN9MY63_9MYCO|nr:phosphotransferase family protein [Mycolicibacter sp. MU0102]CAJ1495688.1 phosphotransferase family protein [Mycolicibacter sp. MU0102]